MRLRELTELFEEVEVLSGLPEDERRVIAGCAQNAVFGDGELLLREGTPADSFYAIRRGRVAIELAPPAGPPLVIETLEQGDVAGWSWLFEPYTNQFDVRALGTVRTIVFDGACLRGKSDSDHDLGYELMGRFAKLMLERLQATRIRLLDLYGASPGV